MEGETNRYDNVAFHIEVAANFMIASEQLINWVKKQDVTKE